MRTSNLTAMQQPAPRRDIATLPLPPSLRQKLTNKGVHTAADLNDITASDLTHGVPVHDTAAC